VLRQEAIDITQLAVDTHGHTDLGMAVSHGTGVDFTFLWPIISAICHSIPLSDYEISD
jgi:hypothetical protein